MTDQERAYNELKSVSRAADVLLAFLKAEEWSIAGLAREVGLHKSVAHRLMVTLSTSGLLIRDSRSGLYRLGPVMIEFGARAEQSGALRRLARPHLDELVRLTGETVSIQVIQGDHGLCVDVVESPQSIRLTISPGHSFPLHAGCAGKIILAFHEPAFVDRLLSKTPLQRYTDNTITDPDDLRRDLAEIRARGYGYSDGEITPGARSVGAPILGRNGFIAASLVVSGPEARLPQHRMDDYAVALLSSARAISSALGHSRQSEEEAARAVQHRAG